MVDRGRPQDLNEAANRFAETLADSYRLVYGQASESAERQQQRAQEFSELVSSNLREQAEAGGANAQQLSEQPESSRRPTRSSLIPPSLATGLAPSKPPRAPRRACAPSLRRPRDCWAPRPGR